MRIFTSLFLVIVLVVVCFPIIILYCAFTLAQGIDLPTLISQPETISTAQVISLAAVILLPLSLIVFISPLFQLTPRRHRLGSFLRVLLMVLMVTVIGYQVIDGRKIYQMYTQKDLVVRHGDSGKATFLLSSLLNGSLGPTPTALPVEDTDFIGQLLKYRQEIESGWEAITPYRWVIEQLADLSVLPQPLDLTRSGTPPAAETLPAVCSIHLAHAALQLELNNHEQGIGELTTLYQVAARGLAGAVHIEEKRTWATTLRQAIRMGYGLAIDINTRYDQLRLLAAGMPRLMTEQTNLHHVWLAEYVLGIERLSLPPAAILVHRFPPGARRPLLLQALPPQVFAFGYGFLFQKNRTAAELKAFWEPVIEAASGNDTAFQQRWQDRSFFTSDPPLRNLSGWYFHQPTDRSEDEQQLADLYQLSELYTAFLQGKLEVNDDFAAYLSTPGRIITSEGDRLRDAGHDGITGTDDDIELAPLY
ncbi:hypothetical protein [Desulfofustis limnaeus]|uniref:Uncharacterized protein n=1 Tax=Desulfofustis limnaeus TaxID=2740163 RepID=A0ABN6M9E1_9BACT|nr:hypothetical protein [Desulfofustis limnaeus]BDD88168.1 hypothetical protein DPPLL_25330 [Desulfofustis limnaeus]